MDWEVGYVPGASTDTLRNFASAVRGGADVKVWLITGTGVVFVRDLPSVAVSQDMGEIIVATDDALARDGTTEAAGPGGPFPPSGVPTVCGAVTDALDTQLDSTTGRDVDRPLAFEWQAFNTTGRRTVVKWPKQPNCFFFGLFCRSVRPISVEDGPGNISWLVRKGWELVYEHNSDGSPRFGSIDHLLFYVQEGYDIKVRHFESSGRHEVHWLRTLRHVTTFQSGSGRTIISGTFADIPATGFEITPGDPFSTAELVFSGSFANEWHVYNTTGQRRVVRFRMRNGSVAADSLTSHRLGWYVRRNDQIGKTIDTGRRTLPDALTRD